MEAPLFIKCEPECSTDKEESRDLLPPDKLVEVGVQPDHTSNCSNTEGAKNDLIKKVPEIIPDIGNMKTEEALTGNLMDIHFENSNPVVKEELENYYSVTEIAHDIKTLEEDGNEDVKIEIQEEACDTLVETLQDEGRGALLNEAKVYSCDICSKSFTRKYYVRLHMETHTGERRYKCTICNCSFMQNRLLKKHLLSHSTNRPYKCLICGSCFKRADNLRTHQITHSDSMPFRCSACGKSFRRLSNYRRHEKSHSDSRPFCCELCGESFKSLTDLGRHKKSHTDRRPFCCPLCGISFKRSAHLRRHEKQKH